MAAYYLFRKCSLGCRKPSHRQDLLQQCLDRSLHIHQRWWYVVAAQPQKAAQQEPTYSTNTPSCSTYLTFNLSRFSVNEKPRRLCQGTIPCLPNFYIDLHVKIISQDWFPCMVAGETSARKSRSQKFREWRPWYFTWLARAGPQARHKLLPTWLWHFSGISRVQYVTRHFLNPLFTSLCFLFGIWP